MDANIKTFCTACICILLSLPILASAEHRTVPENAGKNINLPAGILPANTVHLSTPAEPAVDIKNADLSKVPDPTVRVTASDSDLSHPGALDELIASALERYSKNKSETKIYSYFLELSKKLEAREFDTKTFLIINALKMIDIPYKFGGTSLIGIDCSALVQKIFSIVNIQLPRTAKEQFTSGIPVEKKDIDTGDVLFFKTVASLPSHVGIYLGNKLFIHASPMAGRVMIESLDSPYYAKRFIGAKRIL